MHLEEESVGTECLRSQSHCRHILAVAARLSACGARTLHAVRTIHHHRGRYMQHVGYVAEIDHKIVVSVHVAALGEPHLARTRTYALLIRIFHILAREELRLLDVDGASRPCSRRQQIGLTTQECRYLDHVDNLADGCRLIRLVYVGKQLEAPLAANVVQHLQPALHTHTAIRLQRCTVRLVERRLEYYVHAKATVYLNQPLGNGVQQLRRLDHTRSSYEFHTLDFLRFFCYVFYIWCSLNVRDAVAETPLRAPDPPAYLFPRSPRWLCLRRYGSRSPAIAAVRATRPAQVSRVAAT